jgi:hypothetical protein
VSTPGIWCDLRFARLFGLVARAGQVRILQQVSSQPEWVNYDLGTHAASTVHLVYLGHNHYVTVKPLVKDGGAGNQGTTSTTTTTTTTTST